MADKNFRGIKLQIKAFCVSHFGRRKERMRMKRMRMKRITFLSLSILFVFSFSGYSIWAQPKTIKIGWTGPLSGPAAESGIALKQASVLALEEWNAKGGIYIVEYKKKIPVEILFEDCQSKPEIGVALGEKFIMRDKVHMLLSDALHSSVTMAVMELAPKYGIPIMSIQPVSNEITNKVAKDPKRYWNFWRGNYSSDDEGAAVFYGYKHLIDQKVFKPKNKTFACIFEDSDWGRSDINKAKEHFEGIGWKCVAMESVPIGCTDFYSQMTKIKALEPDVLITAHTALSSGVATVKQFHEVGVKSFLSAIYYASKPEFISQVGKKACENLLWTPMTIDPENIPIQKEFAEKIQRRWNLNLDVSHGCGYDGVNNALDSIERAGSLEPKKIVDTLSKLDRKGVMGRYVFDQSNHGCKGGADFLPLPAGTIIDGKRIRVWPPYQK
jgi:branched-chain amino acid transport system substrate-binding protein